MVIVENRSIWRVDLMTIYQFLVFRHSGELLFSINFTSRQISPMLVAGFISAVCTFSEEVVGHKLTVIATEGYKFIVEEVKKDVLLAALIDDQESILDVRLKIKKVKKIITTKFKNLEALLRSGIPNQFGIENTIREILEEQKTYQSDHIMNALNKVISKILQYTEVKGVIILDKNCREFISKNISKSKRFVIIKQIENLLVHPSIYPLERLILRMKPVSIAVVIERSIIMVALISNNAFTDLVFSTLDNYAKKVSKILDVKRVLPINAMD